jgi:hypothetical protein
MPFVIGFLRFLLLLFLLRLVVRAVARLLAPGPAPARRSAAGGGARTAARVPLVRDRVCNTFLPRERALTARVGGREEHFCSEACRERALREPGVLNTVPRAS